MMYGNAREKSGLGNLDASLQLAGTRLAEYGATRPELQKVKARNSPHSVPKTNK